MTLSEKRDRLADKYAAHDGLVDPTKFYSFCDGWSACEREMRAELDRSYAEVARFKLASAAKEKQLKKFGTQLVELTLKRDEALAMCERLAYACGCVDAQFGSLHGASMDIMKRELAAYEQFKREGV